MICVVVCQENHTNPTSQICHQFTPISPFSPPSPISPIGESGENGESGKIGEDSGSLDKTQANGRLHELIFGHQAVTDHLAHSSKIHSDDTTRPASGS